MRYLDLVLAAAVATAFGNPHGHAYHHRHVQKRVVEYAPNKVETVIVYELNGHLISEEEARQGIANGTLTWDEDGALSSSTAVYSITEATSAPAPKNQPPAQQDQGHTQSSQESQPSSTGPVTSSPSLPSEAGLYQPVDKDGKCADCEKEFPNGKFDCTEFPVGYGAVHLSSEGLGGWSGIQAVSKRGESGFDTIVTVPTGSCNDGTCCTPGSYCSYACPNPYLKMSFPKRQGAHKESVGGLFCSHNGKLEMADGSIGRSLCGRASTRVRVMIQSKLSKSVSICRTDYPGK